MVRKHPANNEGFTLIEIMVVIAITGVIVGMSVPRMSAWRARLDARATARAMGDILHAARTQAIRTGDQHIVYLRVPGVGTGGDDPNGTPLWNSQGADVDVLMSRDSNGDCLIDNAETQTVLTFGDDPGDMVFGLTNTTNKVPSDMSTATLTTGATFADPNNTATATRWILFRPDGVPVGFTGDATSCARVGATGSGAGGLYMTNGTDDFAPVLTALGGVRLHSFDMNANGWTN